MSEYIQDTLYDLPITPPQVVVFTACNVDELLHVDTWNPDSEQRPLRHEVYGGGSGTNTAVGVARTEHAVDIIGAVGSDTLGTEFVDDLHQQGGLGMNTRWIVRKPGPTGRAIIVSSPDPAARAILLSPGANSLYSEADLDAAIAQGAAQAEVVLLTSFVDDEQLRLQSKFLDHLREDAVVCLSPGELYAGRRIEGIERLLRRTNLLVCNSGELAKLVDPSDPSIVRASRILFDTFSVLEAVAITLGSGRKVDSDGMVIDPASDRDHNMTTAETLPGERLPVLGSVILLRSGVRVDTPLVSLDGVPVDTTGAGDAWLSALLSSRILSGMDWPTSGRVAGIIAARSLSYSGGRAGLPNRTQAEAAVRIPLS